MSSYPGVESDDVTGTRDGQETFGDANLGVRPSAVGDLSDD